MNDPTATTPAATDRFDPRLRFDDRAACEQMMGRWSALVAAPFLDWPAQPPGPEWLVVGCGSGASTERLLARQSPA